LQQSEACANSEVDTFILQADECASAFKWGNNFVDLRSVTTGSLATPMERFALDDPIPRIACLALCDNFVNHVRAPNNDWIEPDESYIALEEYLRPAIRAIQITRQCRVYKDVRVRRCRVREDVKDVHEADAAEDNFSSQKRGSNTPNITRGGSNPTAASSVPSNVFQDDKDLDSPGVEGETRELKRPRNSTKTRKFDCIFRKNDPHTYNGENDCFTPRNKGYDELSQLT
jgi:hypothetical protein